MNVLCAFGECGSGKTVGLQALMRRERARGVYRFLIYDPEDEWPGVAGGRAVVARPEHAAAALDACDTVVVRPGETPESVPAFVDELARVVVESRHAVVLVVSEAHEALPEGPSVPRNLRRLLHRWRHIRGGLWLDTQSVAYLSKRALRRCSMCLGFACGADDLRYWRERGGVPLADALRSCAARAVSGQPGWFVPFSPLGLAAQRYELRRFNIGR